MNAIRILLALTAITLTGCASIHARNPADPLESFNRGVYQFNDTVDKAIIKPVAQGYNTAMPVPGKVMVSNFFSNLDDLIVTINDLLQFKLMRTVSDGGRLLINSTVGIFGLIDIATPVGLEKHDEDFGQTLGYWGVGNGPYIVLPILGPSTLRDSVGLYADSRPSLLRRVNHIRTRNQLYLTKSVNRRAQLLDQEKVLEEAAIDRYEYIRDTYLLHRRSEVYDGSPPREKYDEDENGSEYRQEPAPSAPSSRQDSAPVVPAAAPVSTAQQQQPAFAAPEINAESRQDSVPPAPPASMAQQQQSALPAAEINASRPSVHKVWIALRTGIR